MPDSIGGKVKNWLADTGKQLAIAILIVLFLRSSIVEPYKIPSGSMIPTLFIGDHIFVNKFSYGFKVPFTDFILDKPIYMQEESVPARGDVIVFKYPKDESICYIKRVIGLPGDSIAFRAKVLYINNKPVMTEEIRDAFLEDGIEKEDDRLSLTLYREKLPVNESLIDDHPVLYNMKNMYHADYGPIEVPKGKVFVMGDNRDNSNDSRFWGFVPIENIKGKAMFIWLNFVIGFDPQFKFKLRLNRFGTLIK